MPMIDPRHSIREVIVTAAVRTDRGRVRARNEDAFVLSDLATGVATEDGISVSRVTHAGVLLAVFDGCGGHPGGDVASREAARAATGALLRSKAEEGRVRDRVTGTLLRAHEGVRAVGLADPRIRGLLTTAVVALVVPDRTGVGGASGARVVVGHVGDSRVYLLRAGRLVPLTRDHSFGNALVDGGKATAGEAAEHPFAHVLLETIGMDHDPVVATSSTSLRLGDVILLCTDGLHGEVSEEAMRDAILRATDPTDACDLLVDLALRAGGKDNVTVVVAGISGAIAPPERELV